MINIIRNNSPYTVVLLFIFALIVKATSLIHPVAVNAESGHIAYVAVLKIIKLITLGSNFALTLFNIIMLFIQALYLNSITVKHKLFYKPTYIPAYTYILLTSLFPPFNYFSEMVLLNWLFIYALDILMGLHQTSQPRKQIFNLAFALSLATVFNFSSIALVLLLFTSLLLLRSFNIGEWVVAITGFLTPIYFLAGILFLADETGALRLWPELPMSLPSTIAHPSYFIGTMVAVLTLFVMGVITLQPVLAKASVFSRRTWTILTLFLFLSFFISLAQHSYERSAWLCTIPLLSLFISNVFYIEKSKGFSNFAFYFSLFALAFSLYTFK